MNKGFYIVGCEDAVLKDNKAIGFDVGFHVEKSPRLQAERNVTISKEIALALANKDAQSLIASLGFPATATAAEVQELVKVVAENRQNADTAKQLVHESKLVKRLGAGANIAQIFDSLVSIVDSGLAKSVMDCLK